MSDLTKAETPAHLQTSSVSVAAVQMKDILLDATSLNTYHRQFIAKWLLTYDRMSIPATGRIITLAMPAADIETIARAELVPYANRIIEKWPLLTHDVIWMAWDIAVERYYTDNKVGTFPVFNFAALVFWIDRYRHMAAKRLSPDPGPVQPQLKASSLPGNYWPSYRDASEEELKFMLLFPGPSDALFQHVARRLQGEKPAAYSSLQAAARSAWVAQIARSMGTTTATFDGLTIDQVKEMWMNRYRNINDLPSPWHTWRLEIIKLLRADETWADEQ